MRLEPRCLATQSPLLEIRHLWDSLRVSIPSLYRYPSYTSSKLHLGVLQHPTRESYSAVTAYGASKLCNLLFMLEFHRRYGDSGISCTAVHPGNLLPTNLSKNAGCMYKTAFTILRPLTRSVVRIIFTNLTAYLHVMSRHPGITFNVCTPSGKT